jgi:hypothetical protein
VPKRPQIVLPRHYLSRPRVWKLPILSCNRPRRPLRKIPPDQSADHPQRAALACAGRSTLGAHLAVFPPRLVLQTSRGRSRCCREMRRTALDRFPPPRSTAVWRHDTVLGSTVAPPEKGRLSHRQPCPLPESLSDRSQASTRPRQARSESARNSDRWRGLLIGGRRSLDLSRLALCDSRQTAFCPNIRPQPVDQIEELRFTASF